MAEIIETVRIAEKPSALWREIGPFGAIGDWHPMLARVESEGNHPGSLRVAEGRDGSRQAERLLEMAPDRHLYRYRMQATAMPVQDYVGELRVEDGDDGSSTVVWSARFAVTSGDEAATANTVRAFLRTGLRHLKSLHG